MEYASFNVEGFPIVVVTFTGNSENKENFEVYLKGLNDLYKPKKNLSIIFDATNAVFPNVKYQLKQAEWMKANKEVIDTYCKGIAYVIPNALIRKALQLILSVFNNKVPFKVFETLDGAKLWVSVKLAVS